MANQLKLQVLLAAVDKITRPLKSIQRAAGQTSQEMRDTQARIKELNKAAGQVESFRNMNRHLGVTGSELINAKKEAERLAKELGQIEKPTQAMIKRLDQARKVVSDLQHKKAGLTRRVQESRAAMKESGIDTRNLATHQRDLTHQLGEANRALEQQRERLARINAQQKRLTQARQAYDHTKQLQGRLAGSGAVMAAGGGAALYGASQLLAPGLDFGAGMSKVQALTRLDKNDPALQALRQQARDLGASTSFTANDVAGGQSFLAMAGFDPKAIQQAMPGMLDLAKANDTDLATTADIASNILSGFGLEADQMDRLGDVITATTTRANVDLRMLGETMKYMAPDARDLGLSLEESAAMAGLLGNIGIQASQGGTVMRAMLKRLASQTGPAKKAMKELGLETKDAAGNLRSVPDILSDVVKATKNMGSGDRADYLTTIFGTEAGTGVAELIRQQGDGAIEAFVEVLENAAGENSRVAKTMADNAKGDIASLGSAWQDIGIELFDNNNTGIRELIQDITSLTRAVGGWIKANPELVATLSKVFAVVAGLAVAGGTLALTIAGLLGPFAAVKWAATVLGITTMPGLTQSLKDAGTGAVGLLGRLKLLSSQTISYRATVRRAAAGTKAWTLAQWASVKATLAAGVANTKLGFVAVIRGIVGATAALLGKVAAMNAYVAANGVMGTATSLASAGFIKMGAVLKGGLIGSLKAVGNAILFVGRAALFNPVGLVITGLALAAVAIIKYWQPIKAFFIGFWQGLKEGFAPLGETFATAFGAWAGILAPLKPMWDGISWALGTVFGWVGKLLTPLEATSQQLDGATSAGKRFGMWLASIIGFFPKVIANFVEFGGNLMSGLVKGITGKLGEVKDSIVGAGAAVTGWFKEKLGIHSPSRVFAELGGHTMDGLALGINRQQIAPLAELNSLGKKMAATALVVGATATPLATAAQPTTGATNPRGGLVQDFSMNIAPGAIVIHAAPGMDERAIAAQVRRQLEAYQRQQAARSRAKFTDLE